MTKATASIASTESTAPTKKTAKKAAAKTPAATAATRARQAEPDRAPAPLLKDIFDTARLRHIAEQTAAVYPAFDRKRFLAEMAIDYDALSLMERLHRVAVVLHQFLPANFKTALVLLRKLAPRLNSKFVTMILPHYVALYGAEHFDLSMDALKYFTAFGSSEFGVRHFIRLDIARALKIMTVWSTDADEHVRRLASEGSRPRLPWSFRLEPLRIDPSPVAAILDNLKADSSLYVRKSVANHLNDIGKDNPQWVLDRIGQWPLEQAHTAWIARHALRTLIKQGDQQALAIVGATGTAELAVCKLTVAPQKIRLGESITLTVALQSASDQPQKLVIDYAVHYVKKLGQTSAKVFKFKTVTLPPQAAAGQGASAGDTLTITRSQTFRDFSTRGHYYGRHEIELFINGKCLAKGYFLLQE